MNNATRISRRSYGRDTRQIKRELCPGCIQLFASTIHYPAFVRTITKAEQSRFRFGLAWVVLGGLSAGTSARLCCRVPTCTIDGENLGWILRCPGARAGGPDQRRKD